MSLPVAILAGGLATRLGDLARRIPKSLVDVAGRPFAIHQIELLQQHHITDITFLVGHLGEAIADTLGDGSRWGVRLRYVSDGDRPLGTGGALRSALPHLGDPFFVLYGDSYLECDYGAIAHAFTSSKKSALMTVYPNDDKWDSSNVLFSAGRIIRYDKRARTPEMRHIDYGLGAFRHVAFADVADGEAIDLAAIYQTLLARNDLMGYEMPTRFYEIGSPAGLDETRRHLARKGTPVR
jgi:N-acetyl-alpha-D-muramate 1-phosphate uridylyltransferase